MRYLFYTLLLALAGCTGIPEGIEPVTPFKLDRYLGKWYEIARMDHSFERGLQQVTAEYSMHEDGGVKVINRGYNAAEKQWQEAEGKAYFVTKEAAEDQIGHLKVSFFGPFYSSYIIFYLDDGYEHAFITSIDKSYLWLLSRSPTIDQNQQAFFIKKITELGFDAKSVIFVNQQPNQ